MNFRGISFIERILPVPVVFLRLAFSPQLSVGPRGQISLARESLKRIGYIVGFWQRGSRTRSRCAFGCGGNDDLDRVSVNFGSSCPAKCCSRGYATDSLQGYKFIPQRLHSVCVLLWRLPKDEVPLAVVIVSRDSRSVFCNGHRCCDPGRTHCESGLLYSKPVSVHLQYSGVVSYPCALRCGSLGCRCRFWPTEFRFAISKFAYSRELCGPF